MKHCKKCILPETYPGIIFNGEGVCNFCLGYKLEAQVLGKEKLLEVLKSGKKVSRYDCIVPLSGGKDSSFILYYIVKELGLNPLAVSYNSGFQHKIAEENVRNACNTLGVSLLEVRSPGNIQKNLLKASYKLSQKTGQIWGCANCPAILRMVPMIAAKKFKVPFVIWGSSVIEAVSKKNDQKGSSSRLTMILQDPSIGFYALEYVALRIIQRLALKFPLKYALRPLSIPPFTSENPKFIHFYEYVYWDSMKHVNLLENEIGWNHPIGKDSRFDCTLNCIGNVFYIGDYGISHDGLNFCNFVREGRMTRTEALNRENEVKKSAEVEYFDLIERLK